MLLWEMLSFAVFVSSAVVWLKWYKRRGREVLGKLAQAHKDLTH